MEASQISVVLPIHNQEDHLREVVGAHLVGLEALPVPVELLLACNGCRDDSERIAADLAAADPRVRHLSLERKGAGRAYRHGLSRARGELLCIANAARTSTGLLVAMLFAALAQSPPALLKTTRIRSSDPLRKLGSALFTLECRLLLGVSGDVNGTPKIFPRSFDRLLELREDYDAIDAEILAVCRREGYPVLERTITFPPRHSGRSTTGLVSAARAYASVPRLRARTRSGS